MDAQLMLHTFTSSMPPFSFVFAPFCVPSAFIITTSIIFCFPRRLALSVAWLYL